MPTSTVAEFANSLPLRVPFDKNTALDPNRLRIDDLWRAAEQARAGALVTKGVAK